ANFTTVERGTKMVFRRAGFLAAVVQTGEWTVAIPGIVAPGETQPVEEGITDGRTPPFCRPARGKCRTANDEVGLKVRLDVVVSRTENGANAEKAKRLLRGE